MTNTFSKIKAFDHFFDTMEYIAQHDNFKIIDLPHRGIITGLNCASFNVIGVNRLEDSFIESLVTQDFPFLCFALHCNGDEKSVENL